MNEDEKLQDWFFTVIIGCAIILAITAVLGRISVTVRISSETQPQVQHSENTDDRPTSADLD